jgi:plasmid maintenance system antidote protein VapI
VRNVSNALLNEILERKDIKTDYQLAKLLDIRQQILSNYRSGRTQMSDEMVLRFAALIDKDPAPILADLAAERAKSAEVAMVWREAAKRLSRAK